MTVSKSSRTALVVFGKEFPFKHFAGRKYDTIVADKRLSKDIEALGSQFIDIGALVDPGSVYEAGDFLESLSSLELPNGPTISKAFEYKGYQLWWIHYGDLFTYFSLPYTQYKRMLEYLREFESISFFQPSYYQLFALYLEAYGSKVHFISSSKRASLSSLPFGIFLQMVLTILSLVVLIILRCPVMIFTGDKFEQGRDYDFRLKLVYEELRGRRIPFVEFIRSLEPWQIVMSHAITRGRPSVYSEAVAFMGKFLSIISGGRSIIQRKFGSEVLNLETDPQTRFKLMVATQYLLGANDDVWTIRIMKIILRIIGVKSAMVVASSERNIHAVLGLKLNNIPTVGIMHGVATPYGTPYDFLLGYKGDKKFTTDMYGVWSDWWKHYYIKNSNAYTAEQLYVSGPMRPLAAKQKNSPLVEGGLPRVLFVAEQTADPLEVMPYLKELIKSRKIELAIKFRPYRDGFENWLMEHEPDILTSRQTRILKGNMQEAIEDADIVIGCHSTGVLEALLQLRVPIFIKTDKWGDYYKMGENTSTKEFIANNPKELIAKLVKARLISEKILKRLREQYFGDPYRNGSKWTVDKLEQLLEDNQQNL